MTNDIKTLNVYNEEVTAYIFDDRMYMDDFNEWRFGLLNACTCSNNMHPELIHVMFIDDESKTMIQKYVYQKTNGLLLRLTDV